MTQVRLVFRKKLPFLVPLLAQTALRIDAKVFKIRRENDSVLWLVWLDVLSVSANGTVNRRKDSQIQA
jgi:hypothetical protein